MRDSRESRLPALYEAGPRVLFSLLFLADGLHKLVRAGRSIEDISGMGLPAASALNYGAAAIELAGAVCLLAGVLVRPAALVLAVYLVAASFMRNAMMAHEHPSYLLDLARDVAIAGGLVLLAGVRRARSRAESRPATDGADQPPTTPTG